MQLYDRRRVPLHLPLPSLPSPPERERAPPEVLTIAVGGGAGETGPRDVDASHHAGLVVRHLRPDPALLLVLAVAVPGAAL